MSEPALARFAPSPTGSLHLGNARTALFNLVLARKLAGRFMLRIEDTDLERSAERFLGGLIEDLHWLGIRWDEGPDVGGAHAPYRQSERGATYRDFFARLERTGLTYPCFCSPLELDVSRRAQLAAGRPPRYAGTCQRLTPQERAAKAASGIRPTLRFAVPVGRRVEFDDFVHGPQHFATDDIGDFIVRRADGNAAFFFCNAVDDALMAVTHVLRGEDHLTNTPRQILLLEALSLRVPRYGHVALHHRSRRRAAVETPRQLQRAGVSRTRLSPRGDRESPVPPRSLLGRTKAGSRSTRCPRTFASITSAARRRASTRRSSCTGRRKLSRVLPRNSWNAGSHRC